MEMGLPTLPLGQLVFEISVARLHLFQHIYLRELMSICTAITLNVQRSKQSPYT